MATKTTPKPEKTLTERIKLLTKRIEKLESVNKPLNPTPKMIIKPENIMQTNFGLGVAKPILPKPVKSKSEKDFEQYMLDRYGLA